MLLPPAMRDQDPQPSQPFGERKPRPEEIEAQKRAELNKAPAVGKSTNLPTPPQHINDHEMIRRDILPPGSGLIPSLEALAREVIALQGMLANGRENWARVIKAMDDYQAVVYPRPPEAT